MLWLLLPFFGACTWGLNYMGCGGRMMPFGGGSGAVITAQAWRYLRSIGEGVQLLINSCEQCDAVVTASFSGLDHYEPSAGAREPRLASRRVHVQSAAAAFSGNASAVAHGWVHFP